MKRLLGEIHRRSLWQVLGVYLAAAWVALQVVEQLTNAAGLPDWVQPFALVLLVVGLPIVLGTAFVQVGVGRATAGSSDATPTSGLRAPGSDDATTPPLDAAPPPPVGSRGGMSRILTWRNAVLGGVGAVVLLGGFVAAYFVMRATGVGPAASLVAKGVIAEGDPVLLAEFANTSNDPSLGGTVTEAVRVDLSNSTAVTLVDAGRIRDALSRMGKDPDETLTAELAGEVAARDGIKAVVSGEVGSAGSGYILVASISAGDGTPLANFRRAAKSADEIIPAIDALSQDIREKAGESLRSIRAEEPLEAVTTSSLDALRKYSEAEGAEDRGEHMEARRLLEEALELDPEFAMAWRKLAVAAASAGLTKEEARHAATRAYELRDRLTERERYLAAAYYHNVVTGDVEEQIRAYRSVLASYPDDPVALNNLANELADKKLRYEEAIELLERAVSGPGTSGPAFVNLAFYRSAIGEVEGARAAIELMGRRDVWYMAARFWTAMAAGDWEDAAAIGPELVALPDAPEDWRALGRQMPGVVEATRGRLAEARQRFRRAISEARALERPSDVVSAMLDLAEGERIVDPGSGRSTALLQSLLDGDLRSTPASERDYGGVALALVRSDLVGAAWRTMDEWEAAGGLASGIEGLAPDDIQPLVDALATAAGDPSAGAEALRVLRARRDCPRCFPSDLADALERAGDLAGAAVELEGAIAIDEGRSLWWAARRVVAHERLGRLYEEIGEPERAAEHYAVFADAWQDADPELQPRVEAARARIAAIEGAGK